MEKIIRNIILGIVLVALIGCSTVETMSGYNTSYSGATKEFKFPRLVVIHF